MSDNKTTDKIIEQLINKTGDWLGIRRVRVIKNFIPDKQLLGYSDNDLVLVRIIKNQNIEITLITGNPIEFLQEHILQNKEKIENCIK